MNERCKQDGKIYVLYRQEIENANEEASKKLNIVLDAIGASESTRRKSLERAMLCEILLTLESQLFDTISRKKSFYAVGSASEGSTTPGLSSDSDMILCYECNPVLDTLDEYKTHEIAYLTLTDEETKPGYFRLQLVKNHCPFSVEIYNVSEFSWSGIDQKGRIFAKHLEIDVGPNGFRNGPANSVPAEKGYSPRDWVYALRCRQIPSSANSWLHRIRKYGWPSQKQLNKMVSYGQFLVGVGHPRSNNGSIEWRISFSLQERDLMSSLNETQHKCYILLKMIKKNIIESKAGQSISSYHCKTSLFYTIENSQRHIWKDGNLIHCTLLCLKRLFKWVQKNNCPNYFIPDENMFDKLNQMTLKTLQNVLKDVIDMGDNFLDSITCDNVNELLKSTMRGCELAYNLGKTSITIDIDSPVDRGYCYMSNAKSVCRVRNTFLRRIHMFFNTYTGYLDGMMQILHHLQNTNHVTEHTTTDVRMALDSLIPHLQLQYQQCLFVQYLSRRSISGLLSERIPNIVQETCGFDLISSKLALASLYFQFEQYQEECKRMLVSCENSLEAYMISVCHCYTYKRYTNPTLAQKLFCLDMNSKYFRRHCTTACMVFMSFHVSLIHASLHYELFRNVYSISGPNDEGIVKYWLNWITVDSQVYLYFLQYLLYSKTNTWAKKETAVRKLKRVLETDRNLGHKETGLNLLGWIHLQENELQAAWKSFCKSWKIRPFKNAAKWHMLILLSDNLKGN